MKSAISKCNLCNEFFINPNSNKIRFEVSKDTPTLKNRKCPTCKTNTALNDVTIYYQPDVSLDEIGEQFNGLRSFEVFLRKSTATEWFTNVPIKTFHNDEIEAPTAMELCDVEPII